MKGRFDKIRELCDSLQKEFVGTKHNYLGDRIYILGIHPQYHKDLIVVVFQGELMETGKIRFGTEQDLRKVLK